MTCKLHVWVSVGLPISLLKSVLLSFSSTYLLIAGCALSPASDFDNYATHLGLDSNSVHSASHDHRVFSKSGDSSSGLRVYFGSDGTPWVGNKTVARDPTPQRPLTLDLMTRDPGPAVYVGRPCYHGKMRNCGPHLWTSGRFSESVLASMTEATRTIIAGYPGLEVTLIGYSGGGVLALLVAERLPGVARVVTLAANLDTDNWADRHGYLPLSSSINPADHLSWRQELIQLHLSGTRDENVTADDHERLRRKHHAATFKQVADFSHSCCWVEHWPRLLEEALATQLLTTDSTQQ